MRKKIGLLGLVLILVLGFTGCSKSDTTEYDKDLMEDYADYMVNSFNSMTDEHVEAYKSMSDLELDIFLLQQGVPTDGENFLTMIDAWIAGEEECGAYIGHGDFELTTSNDGAALTADAEFEDREGTIELSFDENMNMESITVAAKYSTGEILEKAGLNTILGMGTVFVVLIFISFIIYLFNFIPVLEKKFRKKPAAEAAKPAEAPKAALVESAPAVQEEDDTELAAVIAAAIAASEGTSTDGFVVRSIKRRKSNKWN